MISKRVFLAAAASATLLAGPGASWSLASGPTVKVQQGQLQGAVVDGVVSYKGIPFAAPPVGDLRWREPKAPAAWSGVKSATQFSKACNEVEDCL